MTIKSIIGMIIILIGLSGCATSPPDPVYITSELPPIPAPCVSPYTREPKLDEKRDATDLDALKHVLKMKSAYRSERHLRKSCAEQLKAQRGQ